MSSTSFDTNDTYGSAIDLGAGDANGGGAKSEGGHPSGSGGGGEDSSKAVDDFKDAVEMLTEKRCVFSVDESDEGAFKTNIDTKQLSRRSSKI